MSAERGFPSKLIALNEFNRRIGEQHGRAKLTDEDVELIVSLLEARTMLIAEYTKTGLKRSLIDRELAKAQLSYRWIAWKFEISKSHIRWLALGLQRCQIPARFKRCT